MSTAETASAASGNDASVTIHPLPLVCIGDHLIRSRAQLQFSSSSSASASASASAGVCGLLFGRSSDGGCVEVFTCIELPSAHLLHVDLISARVEQFKPVCGDLECVGVYMGAGDRLIPDDSKFLSVASQVNWRVVLIASTAPSSEKYQAFQLPEMLRLRVDIVSTPHESIAIHALMNTDSSQSTGIFDSKLQEYIQALDILDANITTILNHASGVKSVDCDIMRRINALQARLKSLPDSTSTKNDEETNEHLMAVQLGAITAGFGPFKAAVEQLQRGGNDSWRL